MENKNFKSIYKRSKYLYEITYDFIDYEFGKEWVEERYKPEVAACSSVSNGNFYGRNLDWYFNHQVDFVVNIPKNDSVKYASHSVCSLIRELTTQYMEDPNYEDDIFKAIPFLCVDGQNENGLVASMNVTPLEIGDEIIKTLPTKSKREEICMSMLVRYILDNYRSIDEAVKDLTEHVSIYSNKIIYEMGLTAHMMIKDKTKTVCLEFVDNKIKVIETNYLTNFNLHDVIFNEDGKVFTPMTQYGEFNAVNTNHIQLHGQGLERWNLIVENYENSNTKEGMTELMKDMLNYKKAYLSYSDPSNPYWYTEFTGINSQNDVKVNSNIYEYQYIINAASQRFIERNRDQDTNGTWHTTHTSIYDNEELKLYIFDSSEDGFQYEFEFPIKAKIDEKNLLKLYERFKFYTFNVMGKYEGYLYNIPICSEKTLCSSNTICGKYDILYTVLEINENED